MSSRWPHQGTIYNEDDTFVSLRAQKVLEAMLMEEELTSAVQALAEGKNPSLDGLMTDFFKTCWSFISTDFTIMVNESLRRGQCPNRATHRLIALLSKEGNKLKLTY